MKLWTSPKYRKAPVKLNRTPNAELLDAAWARVYTSGKRSTPTALNILTKLPAMIKTAATASPITVIFDQRPFPDRLGYGHGADKGQDTQQEDHFKKCGGS